MKSFILLLSLLLLTHQFLVVAVPFSGPASVFWSSPTEREAGQFLDVTEIGGFEIRYKTVSSSSWSTLLLDRFANYYTFPWLEGDYNIEIATFDNNGLYSNFISLTAH